jgi:GNAT superfamily N-acetyltransferase
LRFPSVDEYLSYLLDSDVSKAPRDGVLVVESPRRLQPEPDGAEVRGFWGLRLLDGRHLVSVPPGAAEAVMEIINAVSDARRADAQIVAAFKAVLPRTLREAGLPCPPCIAYELTLACNGPILKTYPRSDCFRLIEASIPPAKGLKLPEACFPDGIVYGVVEDEQVVSAAWARRTGICEQSVADVRVATAEAYRGRGYGQTVLSAVVEYITRTDGEARFACHPDNIASIATARSVGFEPYGTSLMLVTTCDR